MTNAVGLLLRY